MYYNNYLEHHGIKGQRWGIIRNKTSSGAKKVFDTGKKTAYSIGKKAAEKYKQDAEIRKIKKAQRRKRDATILAFALMGAYAYKYNSNIKKSFSKLSKKSINDIDSKKKEAGKNVADTVISKLKKGASDGLYSGTEKAAKTVVNGTIMNTTKKVLDKVVGESESGKIFKANDPKQIGKFWNDGERKKDDE